MHLVFYFYLFCLFKSICSSLKFENTINQVYNKKKIVFFPIQIF